MASVSSPNQNHEELLVEESADALEDALTPQQKRNQERAKLRPSRFDLLTSFFMALILFIGTFVTMLFIIWLTSRWTFPPRALEPIIEEQVGRGENPEGYERDFEPPSAEEIEELEEPTLEDTIEAVTDAVSKVAATFMTTKATAVDVTGTGKGDDRPPGPEGEGADVVLRGERWQLDFSAKNIATYARQLDAFEIELGAIGGSIQGVDVASALAGSPKKRLIKDTAKEKRLYFMWSSPSPLKQFDIQLLQKANISLANNRQILKFIPKDLEDITLANLEMDYARSKGRQSVTEIAKTVFECRPAGSGYEFVVTSQRYRKGQGR